jgi:hypothetical protein
LKVWSFFSGDSYFHRCLHNHSQIPPHTVANRPAGFCRTVSQWDGYPQRCWKRSSCSRLAPFSVLPRPGGY